MSTDWTPELAGGDDAPVRGPRRQRMLRAVVLVALAAMVLPLVLSGYGVAAAAAGRACAAVVDGFDRSATGARVAFDLFGEGGPGWLCWSQSPGGERLVANLGVFPTNVVVAPSGERI